MADSSPISVAPRPGDGLPPALVSVIVPVKNEAANIARCLEHLAWADEVFVVDSGSTDATCEIAQRHGARVVQFKWDGQYPKKKNWALKNLPLGNNWVLIVDADELIVPELAAEIGRAVQSPGDRVGFYINRRFIFLGKWLRHCGYYPSWNLRLIKRGHGEYEKISQTGDTKSGDNEVHEHVLCDGPTGWLKNDMIHEAFPTIDVFMEKHNRYSNWEGLVQFEDLGGGLPARFFGHALERRRFIKRMVRGLPFRPTLRFLYGYIFRMGFLDGREGYIFCRLLGIYEFLCVAKYKELKIARRRRA
jgi:glycosyltransferase involved in cell wall biosynthesis